MASLPDRGDTPVQPSAWSRSAAEPYPEAALPVAASTPTPTPMIASTTTMNMATGWWTVRIVYPMGWNELTKVSTVLSVRDKVVTSQSTLPLVTTRNSVHSPLVH